MKKQLLHGFTLIEVMVVVVILGILAAIIVPQVLARPEQARFAAVTQDIKSIQEALSLYKLDNGFYPTTDQGLQALVTKPSLPPIPQNWTQGTYLSKLPVDPWKNPYHYTHPGQHGDIDIWSDGPIGSKKKELGNWDE